MTCTDGCPNANSALYGACWRIASAMGYRRLVTYTEGGESGASLKAAGLRKVRDLAARAIFDRSAKDYVRARCRHLREALEGT